MTNPLQGSDEETQERMTGTTWLEKVGVVESLRDLSRCSARQNPMLSTEELAAFGKLADDHEALLAKLDSLESALRKQDAIFRWLLGEEGEFPETPDDLHAVVHAGKRALLKERAGWKPVAFYWWRSELRKRLDAARADTGEST